MWSILLQVYCKFTKYLRAKNYENIMRFDKVIAKSNKGAIFLPHTVVDS